MLTQKDRLTCELIHHFGVVVAAATPSHYLSNTFFTKEYGRLGFDLLIGGARVQLFMRRE